MLTVCVSFSKKYYAELFNNLVCSWFVGSKKFIDNDIVVSPVKCNKTCCEVLYYFYIYLYDGFTDSYTIDTKTDKFLNYAQCLEALMETQTRLTDNE